VVLNFIFTAGSVFLILQSLKKTINRVSAHPLFFSFLAASYLAALLANPAYYCRLILSLMDNSLYSLLIMLGFCFLVNVQQTKNVSKQHGFQLFALVPFVVVSRPEGIAWALVFIMLYFIIVAVKTKNTVSSFKSTILSLLSFFGTAAALVIFRLAYFGYPLPNTFYAKVSLSFFDNFMLGIQYFSMFWMKYFLILTMMSFSFVALAVLFILRHHERLRHLDREIKHIIPLATISLVFILAGLTIPVFEGGDYFKDFRFYQNIYPLLFLPVIYLALIFKRYFSMLRIAVVFVLFNLTMFYFNPAGWDVFYKNNQPGQITGDQSFRMITEYYIASAGRENGRRLNLIFSGVLPAIGYGSAGGIAYAYHGIVYDLMGLNLTKMAHADAVKRAPLGHAAFNKGVFYELSPDILMPTAIPADRPAALDSVKAYYCDPFSWDNVIFKNIFNDERFKNSYSLATVMNKKESRYKCYGFYSKSFISSLRNNPSFKIEEVL
jgi:hypothetical protein